MRVAAIYDVHGNLPALEAVLGDIRQADVDLVVVGGDVIPGPMPRETISTLMDIELPVHFIHGNGETEILAVLTGGEPSAAVPEQFHEAMRWVAQDLLPEQARLLSEWPLTLRLDLPEIGHVLFCHATPRSDTEIFTRATPHESLVSIFEAAGAPLIICGHTHMQFDRRIGSVRVVNAGSVGMPFGEPGADWLLLGPTLELRHTPYDLLAAAGRIRATAYPQALAFAERHVLHPPAEAEMVNLFERSAVR
jgi:putative phosphoesterase